MQEKIKDDIKIKVIDSDKLVKAINEGSYDVNLSAVMALGAVMLDTTTSKDTVNKNKLVETIKHCMRYPDGLNRLLAIYEGEYK